MENLIRSKNAYLNNGTSFLYKLFFFLLMIIYNLVVETKDHCSYERLKLFSLILIAEPFNFVNGIYLYFDFKPLH